MFCLKCGKEIDDASINCPFCGCATENSGIPLDNYSMDDSRKSADGLGTVAIALGIIGIVIAWLLAILGYIAGGAGVGVALYAKSKCKDSDKAKKGLIISIVALGCSVISSIIGVIIMS